MRRGVAWRLFATAWIVYSLHFSTNVVREHYPAFSLAERGTLRVDPYRDLDYDLVEVEGRGVFINNNPGASILAAIPYALARPLLEPILARVERAREQRGRSLSSEYDDDAHPNRQRFFRLVRERGLDMRFGLATGVIHVLCTAPLSALAVVVMHSLLLRAGLAAGPALALALLYAFGTPVFFRSGYLNHNLFVAHFALFAFALLFRPGDTPSRRALRGAGALAGLGVLCDYSGVVPLAALGLYAMVSAGGGRRAWAAAAQMAAGAALPIAVLLAYQAWAFGNPLLPAQHHMPRNPYSSLGWNGLAWPSTDLMLANLFDPRFGLFTFGPLLVLGLAAPWVGREAYRFGARERSLFLGLLAGLWLFTSANQFARLQWNTGFRMLAPAVPFLFLAAVPVLMRLPRAVAIALGALAVLHSWVLAMMREDVAASWARFLEGGLTLPWLTVLWRTGDQYLPLLQRTGPQALPLVVAAGALLAAVWWPWGAAREGTEAR